MAKFKITKTTTVDELKKQFADEIGGTLRVYDGRSQVEDDVTLVSIGAKTGELECRTSRTVGKFEEAFNEEFNLKVKVYTVDDWVHVLSGVTLESVSKIKRQARKADMEQFVAYKREEGEHDETVYAKCLIRILQELYVSDEQFDKYLSKDKDKLVKLCKMFIWGVDEYSDPFKGYAPIDLSSDSYFYATNYNENDGIFELPCTFLFVKDGKIMQEVTIEEFDFEAEKNSCILYSPEIEYQKDEILSYLERDPDDENCDVENLIHGFINYTTEDDGWSRVIDIDYSRDGLYVTDLDYLEFTLILDGKIKMEIG